MKLKRKLKRKLSLSDETHRAFLEEAGQIEQEIAYVQLEENLEDKERIRSAILTEILQNQQKVDVRKRVLPCGIKQWVAIVVLAVVGIFGFSMSSQANRLFLVSKVEEFFGKETNVRIDNDKNMTIDSGEGKARDEIEKVLLVEIPKFYYMPKRMSFLEYELFPEDKVATMYYQYEDKIVSLYISSNEEESAENNGIDGELLDKVNLELSGIEVDIWRLTNGVNDDTAYRAHWVYKNSYYWLYGNINGEDFEEIVKNILY